MMGVMTVDRLDPLLGVLQLEFRNDICLLLHAHLLSPRGLFQSVRSVQLGDRAHPLKETTKQLKPRFATSLAVLQLSRAT